MQEQQDRIFIELEFLKKYMQGGIAKRGIMAHDTKNIGPGIN